MAKKAQISKDPRWPVDLDADPDEGAEPPAAFDASSLPRFGAVAKEDAQPESEPAPLAERLSDDELAYHRRVWRERQEADAQALVTATVMGAWCRHLEAKYDLGPGDHVDEDGAITRKGFTDG